ncbi:hypothetical protein ABEX78_21830 [Priestia megaterium]
MKLRQGDQYKSKETGKIFTLRKDYNGVSWFLYCKDKDGVTKSHTFSALTMVDKLNEHYLKYKKQIK